MTEKTHRGPALTSKVVGSEEETPAMGEDV